MIEEQALVISVSGESATLEVVRQKACGICGQTRGCGNSTWGKLFSHRSATFSARNTIQAQTGDFVIIGIAEHAVLRSALLLYVVPLATMFISAALFRQVPTLSSDFYVILGAILGLVLGFLFTKYYVASKKYTSENEPIILRQGQENAIVFECHRGK